MSIDSQEKWDKIFVKIKETKDIEQVNNNDNKQANKHSKE